MKIAIITAYAQEAATFARKTGMALDGEPYAVITAGSGPTRATRAAAACLSDGCDMLLSWGLAGGLDPSLAPATLVVADDVVAGEGESWPCDPEFRLALLGRMVGLGVRGGRLASVPEAVATTAGKTGLRQTCGATIVDMESAAIARAASAARARFAAVRCIVDPATFALPRAALAGMRSDGGLAPWSTAATLLRHPGELPDLLRLAVWYRAALQQLARGAALISA